MKWSIRMNDTPQGDGNELLYLYSLCPVLENYKNE